METVLLNQSQKIQKLRNYNEETVLLDQGNAGEETILLETETQNKLILVKLVWEKNGQIISINKKKFVIGRKKEEVDFCIQENRTISRVHAEIIVEEEHVYVVDNYATNHVYVNNSRIDPNVRYEIFDGDTLRLSSENFKVVVTVRNNPMQK